MNTPNTKSTPCLKSIFPRCYHLILQTGQACAFLLAALVFAGFLTAPAHGQVSVYTQNYDTRRSGSNNEETVLTPALVQAGPTAFGKLFTLSLDNNLPCMPLILGGLNIPGEPTNILLLKTGSEGGAAGASSLWAFNADTGTKLWQLSFGSSVGDGSAGTPVIDPTVGTDGAIYLMTYVNHLNQLHAIDPIKGIELAGSPVTIAASASGVTFSNSAQQNTRPALLLFNGVIYLVSSHALDTGTYHGWVIGYKYTAGSGFTLSSAFCSTPSGNQGGIWQGGGGMIADSSSIYAATGNGSFNANTGGTNYSMSLLRFSPPSSAVVDWFTPTDEAGNSNADRDFNGGGMTLIPGTTDIFLGPTKYGAMYLVNTANLGHFGAPIQSFTGFGVGVGHDPISWNSGSAIYAYVWASGTAINQFSYDTPTGKFSPAGAFKKSSFAGGGTLTISSNNGSNGILWATGSGELHAMNPADVSAADYWNSNMNAGDSFTGGGGKYSFSTVANGKVYVATSSSTVVVYGAKAPPPPPPAPPTNLAATAVSSSQINLSWTASTTSGVSYSIFRSTTSGFTPSSSNQIASGVSGTTFSDTGLAASTTYFYLAKAVDSAGTSAASNQASATTMPGAMCTTVPSAPTGLTATAVSSSQINLSWTGSTAGPGCSITYNVYSSTTSGVTATSGNLIATGVSGTTFNDTGLAASTTYFYVVEAVDSVGASTPSNEANAMTQPIGTLVAINAGGPAVGSFLADEDFAGGKTIDHANTINTSKVTNPAPAAVYQSARIGVATTGAGAPFTYTIGGMTAGSSHTVRLHFAETFFTTKGSRVFNVSINGEQVLNNFDIIVASGGQNIANIQEFMVPANASGQYVITFTSVTNNALISGIEID
jgi:Malectin domain/Fibronectin type III domain